MQSLTRMFYLDLLNVYGVCTLQQTCLNVHAINLLKGVKHHSLVFIQEYCRGCLSFYLYHHLDAFHKNIHNITLGNSCLFLLYWFAFSLKLRNRLIQYIFCILYIK